MHPSDNHYRPLSDNVSGSWLDGLWDTLTACIPKSEDPQHLETPSEVDHTKERIESLAQKIENNPANTKYWVKIFELRANLENTYLSNIQNKKGKNYSVQQNIWDLFKKCSNIYIKNRKILEHNFINKDDSQLRDFFLLSPIVDPIFLQMRWPLPSSPPDFLQQIYTINQIYEKKFRKNKITANCQFSCIKDTREWPYKQNPLTSKQNFSTSIQFFLDTASLTSASDEIKKQLTSLDSGGDPLTATASLINFLTCKIIKLKEKSSQVDNNNIQDLIENSQFLETLLQRLQRGLNLTKFFTKKQASSFKKEYRALILNLHPGHGFVFQGGYWSKTDPNGGHAITFEIERQNNYLYCFRKINTGEGASEGVFSESGEGNIVQSFPNLSLETLMHEDLIALLSNHTNNACKTKVIEQGLVQIFEEGVEQSVFSEFVRGIKGQVQPEFESKLQNFGTCSISSIWGWLRYRLQEDSSILESLERAFWEESIEHICLFYKENPSLMDKQTYEFIASSSFPSKDDDKEKENCGIS